jgi:hypothetical protein
MSFTAHVARMGEVDMHAKCWLESFVLRGASAGNINADLREFGCDAMLRNGLNWLKILFSGKLS